MGLISLLNSEPYTRQELLTSEFANILEELVIPAPILEWLSDAVLNSDQTERAARAQSVKQLQFSPDSLQNGPRRQGSAAPRKTSAPLTAPGRSTD